MSELKKIEVYVPQSHLEAVKSAMFAAGGGRVGDYDSCAWQTLGQGQYRPLEGSAPYQGQTGEVESASEYKLEMVCEAASVSDVVTAMKTAHPYEEVAFSVIATESWA